METIILPHLPQQPLRVGLFENVTNAAFLRQQLLAGNADFEYAFLDAAALLSRRHLLAACFRAINDSTNGRMKSRNVHSEIVFSLSPNNNIAESFRRFGISDDTRNVVAIKVGGDPTEIDAHLLDHMDGTCVPFTDERLSNLHDHAVIKKAYRIDVGKEGMPATEAFLLGSIALKGS